LAPEPLTPDPSAPGGLRDEDVALTYEIATDPGMRSVVRRGSALGEAAYAHSVHVEVRGLAPGRPYWYRFTSGEAQSRIGHARTAPALGSPVGRLRFGFVSCANYEQGYFAGYRHLTDEHPDLVLFLGDYIYEHIERRRPTVRRHSDGVEATTLPTYRNRYAQYRLDTDLQRLHAEIPILVTWDDHEVQDDYADQWSDLRRSAAVPGASGGGLSGFTSTCRPTDSIAASGTGLRLYDRFFGNLVEFSVLDGRQYRSRQACYGRRTAGAGTSR
jgi:alkaline phosphatase D